MNNWRENNNTPGPFYLRMNNKALMSLYFIVKHRTIKITYNSSMFFCFLLSFNDIFFSES